MDRTEDVHFELGLLSDQRLYRCMIMLQVLTASMKSSWSFSSLGLKLEEISGQRPVLGIA